MNSPKSCSTCEHRSGIPGFSRCDVSGFLCETERKYPSKCGVNFDGWVPRLGLFQRIYRFFAGHKS